MVGKPPPLGDRLAVGQQILTLFTVVRIHVPQPIKKPPLAGLFYWPVRPVARNAVRQNATVRSVLREAQPRPKANNIRVCIAAYAVPFSIIAISLNMNATQTVLSSEKFLRRNNSHNHALMQDVLYSGSGVVLRTHVSFFSWR